MPPATATMTASAKEKALEREKVRMACLLGVGCGSGPMAWRDSVRNARVARHNRGRHILRCRRVDGPPLGAAILPAVIGYIQKNITRRPSSAHNFEQAS